MTPQERQLVDDLFDRLSRLENAPREPEALAAIADGLRRAPNAIYTLVQTVLVQDEALKRADAHIQELEAAAAAAPAPSSGGGFLDSMRDAILGPSSGRGSVPNIPPGSQGQRGPVWNSGQVLGRQDDPRQGAPMGGPGGFGGGPFGGGAPAAGPFGGGGSSFLGTAAAAAAGVVGGSMLMNGIRGLMGGGSHQSFGDASSGGSSRSPWDTGSSSSDLSRDAGVNDIGKSNDNSQRASSYDQAQADADQDQDQDQDDDDDYDADQDSGDGDYA